MDYITPSNVASYLGISADTVRRKIRSGDIPARRIPARNGHYRIPLAWLVDQLGFDPTDNR